MRLAEAKVAMQAVAGKRDPAAEKVVEEGFRALLDFAEHDFGGTDWRTAALSADVRAGAAARALSIARSLGPDSRPPASLTMRDSRPEATEFTWRRGRVAFDPSLCAVASLVDDEGRELVPRGAGLALGEFVHTRYEDGKRPGSLFPKVIPTVANAETYRCSCLRSMEGVEVVTEGRRAGFGFRTRWFFHESEPWIDITYGLEDGWSADPQSVQICFRHMPWNEVDQEQAVLVPAFNRYPAGILAQTTTQSRTKRQSLSRLVTACRCGE